MNFLNDEQSCITMLKDVTTLPDKFCQNDILLSSIWSSFYLNFLLAGKLIGVKHIVIKIIPNWHPINILILQVINKTAICYWDSSMLCIKYWFVQSQTNFPHFDLFPNQLEATISNPMFSLISFSDLLEEGLAFQHWYCVFIKVWVDCKQHKALMSFCNKFQLKTGCHFHKYMRNSAFDYALA
jgi:hypothetical protein